MSTPGPPVTASAVLAHARSTWAGSILGALADYIRIPALSPAFDAAWATSGELGRAVDLVADWCRRRPVPGLVVEVVTLPGRTPTIVMEVPATAGATATGTVLLYGHYDKQPEMTGWRDGLGPWTPVRDGDRLYGRGGVDDGYAAFAAVAALEALHASGGEHGRVVVLVEGSEESGSPDLPAYIEALAGRLGEVSLVIGLDGGGATYDRLWTNTSLRGLVGGVLRVDVLREGVHSGTASGVVSSSFRVLRRLLDRIEDAATGRVLLPEAHVEIPPDRVAEAAATAAAVPDLTDLPTVEGMRPTTDDPTERLLRQTWRPALSVTGADGLPPTDRAGNVLRPFTALRLSLRLPPGADPGAAARALEHALTTDPPDGARVSFVADQLGAGWEAPPTAPWLAAALDRASQDHFGKPHRALAEGGSIPFMGMLGARFPQAQFVITGALGPGSNAHGPNEFLHLPTAERITASVATLLDAHART